MRNEISFERHAWRLGLWLVLAMGCSAEEDTARTTGVGGANPAAAGAGAAASNASAAGDENTTAAAGESGTSAGSGGAGSASDQAGSGAAGGPSDGRGQPCNAIGDTRVCCDVGVQSCEGEAELPVWGPCMDTGGVPIVECNPCGSTEFGPGCDAGAPPPPDAGAPPPTPDAGPPEMPDAGSPPTECGPGMECKPGKVRYCDDPAGEWTMSTCDATGHWGACVPVPVPPAAVGHGDCSDFDYSPEMCCGPAMICCQDNPGGPWVDFGSGACVAVSCP